MIVSASLDAPGLVIAPCRHGDFAFYQGDMIGKMLLTYGEWAEQEVRFLSRWLRKGDTVVDIGAHIGTLTVPFARAVGPSGKVFAFEAQRLIYYNLCTNITLNGLANVTAVNAIASATDGSLRLEQKPLRDRVNSGGFIVAQGVTQTETEETTPKLALDGFFRMSETCRMIKIDVEGYEAAALMGLRSFIARAKPILFVEANTRPKFDRIFPILNSLGYMSFWMSEPHFNPNNFRQATHNFYGDQTDLNLVCFHQSWDESIPDLMRAESFDAVERFAAAV